MAQPEATEQEKGVVDELTSEIKRVIDDNRKFLERIMADDFDDDELPDEEPEMTEEEQ
ncbi:hypothetical protein KI809_13065 [Geobacter pelophilus]|jgi:hypothetical protein|uniref:Uncharacterized protein n=1 Tax=Geoanaerobacter pelophilus TaxID=60036 RepID=A0AAW4LDL4_9BACT|nr:hypothetical protein [Geoanaerobacter pelophilus]MBT0665231.1 hypothetical protein [Geoanaerobacter pelophilus]